MRKRRATAAPHTALTHVKRGIGSIVLRRFDPSRDSYEQLTTRLHRAFARLGMMGLNCTCVNQDVAVHRDGVVFALRCRRRLVKRPGRWIGRETDVCCRSAHPPQHLPWQPPEREAS